MPTVILGRVVGLRLRRLNRLIEEGGATGPEEAGRRRNQEAHHPPHPIVEPFGMRGRGFRAFEAKKLQVIGRPPEERIPWPDPSIRGRGFRRSCGT